MIPSGDLPPLQQRDLPEPIPMRRMVGPGIILAGLALGSGEFIIWPYITYQSKFVFFWACLVGVTMQYFLNMEIMRWTLATGENAITGFCRLSRHWAPVFLILNIVPWMVPAWATSAAELTSWLVWGEDQAPSWAITGLSVAGLVGCGIILTAGPVIYETVERMQMALVAFVMIVVVLLAVWLLRSRPDAIQAQFTAAVTFGAPEFLPDLTPAMLLGALAFAGAGGTLNLAQGDYIKEKGYGMGKYIGRMTSPITGRAEATSEFGYQFPPTEQNLARWRRWWINACWEHFLSFFVTCAVCLTLLTLIAYCLTYNAEGVRTTPSGVEGLDFIAAEASQLSVELAPIARILFLLMGIAILLTTEFGVLDAITRISTDVIKVRWLRESPYWTESRLYYALLWALILLGSLTLLVAGSALSQIKYAAAMNGGVMFLYSFILVYLNRRNLPSQISMPLWRLGIMLAVVAFFGFFTVKTIFDLIAQLAITT